MAADSRFVYHIEYRAGRWLVLPESGSAPARAFPTKPAAVFAARDLAVGTRPSRVVVHARDGEVEEVWEFGAG